MTKSRRNPQREIVGLLGSHTAGGDIVAAWNKYYTEKGIDGVMIKYPCKKELLPERLSEMYHFHRRLYLVGPDLQREIVTLLDEVADSRVTMVINADGILKGKNISNIDFKNVEKIIAEIT